MLIAEEMKQQVALFANLALCPLAAQSAGCFETALPVAFLAPGDAKLDTLKSTTKIGFHSEQNGL